MKTVNDVLTKVKGKDKVSQTVTGKGSFSKAGFGELTSALVNDLNHKSVFLGKDGKEASLNISELIRADFKKTLANAKYPQKPEANVIDTVEIATDGLAQAIPHIIAEQVRSGKKFSLPHQKDMVGDIYLAAVPGKTRTSAVRDIKTQEDLGTTTITTKDSVQLRAKSPVPAHLQTKVRRDKNGQIMK